MLMYNSFHDLYLSNRYTVIFCCLFFIDKLLKINMYYLFVLFNFDYVFIIIIRILSTKICYKSNQNIQYWRLPKKSIQNTSQTTKLLLFQKEKEKRT